MKKVLIIGYFWPYIGGSKRVIGLAKSLPEFGWQPIILTGPLQQKPDSEFRVIETDFRGFLGSWVRLFGFSHEEDIGDQVRARVKERSPKTKSFLRFSYNFVREIIAYPDEYKGWEPFALRAASELLEREKVDALISIYPYTSHVIANELKKRYEIPWIADLADLWSLNSAYGYGPLRRLFDKRLERKTLLSADVLTTSSWPLAERLSRLHRGKSVSTIHLGFEPDMVNIPLVSLTTKFTVTYTGIFYRKKREPSKFFAALSSLISDGIVNLDEVEVRIYGRQDDWVEREIKKYRLSSVVRQYAMIPKEQCFEKQKESQLLLQLNWEDKREKGVFSGKMLDYLAAQRPILAAGGSGYDEVVKEILFKTTAGVYCPQIEDIKNALAKFYREYKQVGRVTYNGDWAEIEKYSNREMAKKFADILNQLTER